MNDVHLVRLDPREPCPCDACYRRRVRTGRLLHVLKLGAQAVLAALGITLGLVAALFAFWFYAATGSGWLGHHESWQHWHAPLLGITWLVFWPILIAVVVIIIGREQEG